MNLCIGAETAKPEYIFADIVAMTLIGKTARMYVNMPLKGDA